jgi:hypothetical protein
MVDRGPRVAESDDPGVPGALPRALRTLAGAVTPERIDRIWVFPPLRRGRRETGVLAAGCYTEGPRHLLVTLSYRSEETGSGVAFESVFQEEGEAPPDRLPKVIEGVVRRLKDAPGEPTAHEVGGDPKRLAAVVGGLDPAADPAGPPGSADPSGAPARIETEE